MSSALVDPMASVRAYLEVEKAHNRPTYKTDWADFQASCEIWVSTECPLPQASVARHLAHLADGGRKPSTIQRRAR